MIPPYSVQVRFRDIDVLGHVNNAVYLSYLEMTRVYYLEKTLGQQWNYDKDGFLLARNEIDYLAPIFLYDKPQIEMFVTHIGNRSFTFGYEIKVEGKLVTKAKSVMVAWNNKEKCPISIPPKLLEVLSEHFERRAQ